MDASKQITVSNIYTKLKLIQLIFLSIKKNVIYKKHRVTRNGNFLIVL
jgi:hypothetical protein